MIFGDSGPDVPECIFVWLFVTVDISTLLPTCRSCFVRKVLGRYVRIFFMSGASEVGQ